MSTSSRIFTGFRALGFTSNHVPLDVRYNQKHKENYVVTCVGKAFHTYNCSKLGIVSVSNAHPKDISCIAVDAYLVFTACENVIRAFSRGREVCHKYEGHDKDVHLLLPFGNHLISVDVGSAVKVWDIENEEEYLELQFDNQTFQISTLVHPSTYLNKILFGSQQGALQLWNIRKSKLLHTFTGWGMAITVLEQAPALDVIAVGLADGRIFLHNIKYDETVVKFIQDWGPITTISFRTDGHPVMVTGSTVGHIALWNLEKKKLQSQIREAHSGGVTGMKCLASEPLLITSSSDNSIKPMITGPCTQVGHDFGYKAKVGHWSASGCSMDYVSLEATEQHLYVISQWVWIFDLPDGGGRLLRHRAGHGAPPNKIRFHGNNSHNILSAGQDSTLMSFSTVHDSQNKSLGRASYNKKETKKSGLRLDKNMMPPIVDFDSESTRQSDWDSIAACHRGKGVVTLWNYQRSTMGAHWLKSERLKEEKEHKFITAQCVCVTACGNFAVVGYSSGHVDVYNMQSGMHRGCFGLPTAHSGCVRGVAVDGLNQVTVSAGADGCVKFWKFKTKELLESVKLETQVAHLLLHRESSMLAVACDDFALAILDIDTRKVVRWFNGHLNAVTDMAFSPDARWLVTASMDSTLRTWDLPTGRLLDCFLVDAPVSSLTMSPSGEFLVTTHIDDLGIYLWSNMTLYTYVALRPLPADYEPQLMTLPSTSNRSQGLIEELKEEEETYYKSDFMSPDQISDQLVTLSLLPTSRWLNLLNLETIKQRNKPKQPPKVPKAAPFFLPTVAGLELKFVVDEEKKSKEESKLNLRGTQALSELGQLLWNASNGQQYEEFMSRFKNLGPSALDLELRSFSPEGGGSAELMERFMLFLDHMLQTNRDFELTQAYLALFIKLHGDYIATEPALVEKAKQLQTSQLIAWEHLQDTLNQSLCLVNYLRTATL